MDLQDFKSESRKGWGKKGPLTNKEIQLGCIMRIADSLEKIEHPYQKLLKDNEYLAKRNKDLLARIDHLEKSRASYKGMVTKMKNRNSES